MQTVMDNSLASRATRISQALHASAANRPDATLWLAAETVARVPDEPKTELEAAFEKGPVSRVWLIDPQVDRSLSPRWLALNTEIFAGSALLQDSIEQALVELESARLLHGQGRRIAGWLELDGTVLEATFHISKQMILRGPQGGRHFLRLHDPAVLWALWLVLTPVQQRSLLGPINTWWMLDPAGQLLALRAASEQPGTEPADSEPWTAQQWMDIANITPLNRALRHPRAQEKLLAHGVERAHRIGMQAMRRAHALGFTDIADMTEFTLHALTVHPHFDQHPHVQQALEKREPGDHYTALVDGLSQDDWHAIETECASANG